MRLKVYIETSIISYLAALPSRDLIVAAHQQTTHDWWDRKRFEFELYASQLVVREASRGDADAALRRLEKIKEIELVKITQDAEKLAQKFLNQEVLPKKAADDALHIAISTVNGMDYLLTWNFKYIANAETRTGVENICRQNGYQPPIICTPEELLGE
jgi:hypothetical protein